MEILTVSDPDSVTFPLYKETIIKTIKESKRK